MKKFRRTFLVLVALGFIGWLASQRTVPDFQEDASATEASQSTTSSRTETLRQKRDLSRQNSARANLIESETSLSNAPMTDIRVLVNGPKLREIVWPYPQETFNEKLTQFFKEAGLELQPPETVSFIPGQGVLQFYTPATRRGQILEVMLKHQLVQSGNVRISPSADFRKALGYGDLLTP